jgi:Big-like domain-containing protein
LSKSTSIHSLTLGALLLGAVTLAPSAQAQSCSTDTVVNSSYPADGATGVPTNAPLYIYGSELDAGSDVTLQDDGGMAVSIDVQAADGGLLIDAFLGLDPNTTYELTVTDGGEEWSASFTTGAGPATRVQLRAPDVGVSVIDQDRGACGVVSAICVIGTVSARRTLEVVIGDEVLSVGDEPAPAYTASAGPIAANGCVEVRVREPGGSVSETTRVCGDDLGRFELAANAPAPTSCQAYRTVAAGDDDDDDSDSSSESGGCAMGASGAASGVGGLFVGAFALLAARCRSARKGQRKLGSGPAS